MADSRRSPRREYRQEGYSQHSTASPRKRLALSLSRQTKWSPGSEDAYSDNHKSTSAYRRRSPPKRRRLSPSPIRDSPPRENAATYHRPSTGRGRGRNILAEQEKLTAQLDQQRSTEHTTARRPRYLEPILQRPAGVGERNVAANGGRMIRRSKAYGPTTTG